MSFNIYEILNVPDGPQFRATVNFSKIFTYKKILNIKKQRLPSERNGQSHV
jgi:hypothetical protein